MFALYVGLYFHRIGLAVAASDKIAFYSKNYTYDEDYSGDKSGIILYKAAGKFKYVPIFARVVHI
jgi:hypothetical protein